MGHHQAPVIPLENMVFFPTALLPLELDGQIYPELARKCFAERKPIILTLYEHPATGERPCAVACIGEIIDLTELQDGTVKVMALGLKRIHIDSFAQQVPHLIANFSHLPDLPEGEISFDSDLLYRPFEKWTKRLISKSAERDAFLSKISGLDGLTHYISMFMVKDLTIKQHLLETLSLSERANFLAILYPNQESTEEDPWRTPALKEFAQMDTRLLDKASGH